MFDAIVFDLGGVLIELHSTPPMLASAKNPLEAEHFWQRWLHSATVRGFESGKMSANVFARAMVEELGLRTNPEQFIQDFATWPIGPYAGAKALLEQLGNTYTLACLSNTNALHWPRICGEMGLERFFDYSFVSHQTGLLKPDRPAFEQVLTTTNLPAERVVFLDDNRLNVEAAQSVGIASFQTRGLGEVVARLSQLGIIQV